MNYSYQAVDSVTGTKYAWTSATPDPTGTGYPGPNSPTHVLQTSVQSSGGGGVGWGSVVTTTAATYAPTESVILAGLVIASGRAGAQEIILPDITENTPVLVEIHGFNSSISTTNVVNIVGTGIDAETAFIDAQGDFLTFRWVKTHWVRL